MHWLERIGRIGRSGAVLGSALALAVVLALGGLASGVPGASAHAARGDVVGHVYVNDNTAGTNTVAGFARHANGTLTPLPGSPFAVGGAGTGTILGASQGALQVSSDGRYLLAVDAGSNQISVLRIARDGALRQIHGSPFASGGSEPVSIAVHDRLVYVANNADGGANYAGFTFDDGRLTPLAGATVALPNGSLPGDVFFNSTGTRLVGTRVGTSLIDSFVVDPHGHLSAAPGSPFAAQAAGPFGSAFRPSNPTQLFVSNAHAGAGNGSVSAFHDAHNGALTSIGASPFLNGQAGTCWVDITPNGQYLFAVNTGTSTISRYAIAPTGALTLLGNTPFASGTGLRAFDLRVSPDGANAYVVLAGLGKVAGFAVHGGTLTELSASPFALPTGATPLGIVVTRR